MHLPERAPGQHAHELGNALGGKCSPRMHEPNAAALFEARTWLIGGRVQGVGFRPYVFRTAQACGINGHVRNRFGQVEIFGEGPSAALDEFALALVRDAPAPARIEIAAAVQSTAVGCKTFRIVPSEASGLSDIHVPPDYACCADCLREMNDPRDRRYRYPFINCTQCGPRYTLIMGLPYDRANTSMAQFVMCADCRAEYEDPASRRFHAQAIACPHCGPSVVFRTPGQAAVDDSQAALSACVAALRAGRVVAVKGVGGYHLMADASDERAVARLRQRKQRAHKPLAVMFPAEDGLDALRASVSIDAATQAALADTLRPIVLLKKKPNAQLAAGIAPGLAEIGVMLPYSPLHHLLLAEFGRALVATSANVSGEPVLTENSEAERRLGAVADSFLHHQRPIVRPADDSVVRVIAGKARPLRLGRGFAPLEMTLPVCVEPPMLALGAHMKNTVALAWGNRVAVSAHIGELNGPRALAVFESTIADLQTLYGVRAQALACDAHPGYGSTRWAKASHLPVTGVFHHRAHASALAGEHPEVDRWLVFTWDGVGYGEDGSLWGGEALLGRPGQWQRYGSMRTFSLPGAERAGREPWRSAAALCWEAGRPWRKEEFGLAFQAWKKRLNTPKSSAVGRLFDAAAVLCGLLDEASFEGQGPMWLEAIASPAEPLALPLNRDTSGVLRTDWAPLVAMLLDASLSPSERAGIFHASLAHTVLEQARAARTEHDVTTIGLGGGVFQNRLLTESILELLGRDGFDVRIAARVPCNDAGLSFGQIIEAASRR